MRLTIDNKEARTLIPEWARGELGPEDQVTCLSDAVGLTEAGVHDPSAFKAVFVLGAGGSGKSGIAQQMFGGTGMRTINQDSHLERFFAERRIPLRKIGSRYDLFKKAQGLARKEVAGFSQAGVGLVVEITGWDYSRVEKPVKMLRERGYDCYVVIVVTSRDTALRRNRARAEAGGRNVPRSFIDKALTGVQRNLGRYARLFGEPFTLIIDNDKDLPPERWEQVVKPALARAGSRILKRRVQNPIGKQILRSQVQALKMESEDRATVVVPSTLSWG